MQKSIYVLLLGAALAAGCKKKESNYRYDLPTVVQQIVPEALIDTLRSKGMVINEGLTPPALTGIFRASPFELFAPYGPEDSWKKGKVIGDYKYRFYDQSADKVSIKVDSKQPSGNDTSTGLGAFVAGKNNSFTIFAEVSGTTGKATYKQLAVISGEISAQGIRNFQYSFILKEKNDPNDELIAAGKARVWRDSDALSPSEATYRLAAEEAIQPTLMATMMSSRER